jgi:hypothetical protein
MKGCGYSSTAHDAMLYQTQSTYDPMSSLRPVFHHNDNIATLDQPRNMSLPRDISWRNYANNTEHATGGTPAASHIEVDSPTPRSMQNPTSHRETTIRQQSFVAEASALLTVGQEASSSEGLCFAAYRQLVDGLLQQCNMLMMERNAMAGTLYEVRRDLIEQQVSRIEDGASLEDINTRLWACNSVLEAKLRSQNSPQRVELSQPSLLPRSSTHGSRKRKRYSEVVDLGVSRKRRRCA